MTSTATATTINGSSSSCSNIISSSPHHHRYSSMGLRPTTLSLPNTPNWAPSFISHSHRSHAIIVPRATTSSPESSGNKPPNKRRNKNKNDKKKPQTPDQTQQNVPSRTTTSVVAQEEQQKQQLRLDLEDVNPVGLGRRSRQLFDEVWRKFSGLGQISSTSRADQRDALDALLIREGPMCEFAIPGAQNTTVLVVGPTSRIGRLVVRKLMLRGYSVKALVRKADEQVVDMLPRSVEIVVGDVGDPATLMVAVEGCNKVIYCATARSAITGDLFRVDQRGVYNLSKAFQDYNNKLAQLRAGKSSKSKLCLAKFKTEDSLVGWEARQGTYFQDVVASKYDGGMDAKFEFTETGEAVFSGYVFSRGGYVELTKRLSLPLGRTLDRYEGLVLSVGGNGKSYVLILEAGPLADTSQSKLYFARFSTKVGFCRVRVPFSSFRPVKPDDPPLDPFLIHTLTIRFEPRKQKPAEGPAAGVKQDPRSFKLILEYIKALPTGQETDFILVSCTGSGLDPTRREQVLKAKRAGEDSLRKSGLGYTIIRPGPLKSQTSPATLQALRRSRLAPAPDRKSLQSLHSGAQPPVAPLRRHLQRLSQSSPAALHLVPVALRSSPQLSALSLTATNLTEMSNSDEVTSQTIGPNSTRPNEGRTRWPTCTHI
ncbi:protein HIGH CHLOROPHYLL FLUORESCENCE PHENOTYPE 173, chloroplastic isoform X1 [Humulus lupulus]|uniref:protein HIGH CHLOROPHYLL FLUORESCENCE PHENOTYPE 173, chloroplastic isoform X1 n=1 Tax=Humulus lupulus TaxID=3486 RepID=UPI002B407887|nr:protein HIGH CHLOROPHYLL FLUORESCENCE PHENOTYPE 173, chloroplastic isoform X1 [Humulus lupulus]